MGATCARFGSLCIVCDPSIQPSRMSGMDGSGGEKRPAVPAADSEPAPQAAKKAKPSSKVPPHNNYTRRIRMEVLLLPSLWVPMRLSSWELCRRLQRLVVVA